MPLRPVYSEDGEMVTIRTKWFFELQTDSEYFIALQNAGVDNWEGYAAAVAHLKLPDEERS